LPFAISDQVNASVDVGTGNLEITTQGISLAGVNGGAPIGATFNSLATNVGSVSDPSANKWAYNFDEAGALSKVTGGIVYTGGDGSTWLFSSVAGSSTLFTSPAGLKATLVATVSGATVTGFNLTTTVNQTVVSFDANGVAHAVTDKNGNSTTFNVPYSTPGSMTSTAGPTAGRTAAFSYSGAAHTLTVTQTSGSLTRNVKYVKDGSSNLTSFVDANGNSTSFGYTSGQLTSITSVTGAVTNITYDASGKVSEVDQLNTTSGSPGTSTTRLTYPSSTQTLVAGPDTSTATAVATGPHSTYTIGSGDLVASVVDAAGRSRAATYNGNLDTTSTTSGASGGTGNDTPGTTSVTYGANSGLSATKVQAPGGAANSAAYANTAATSKYLPSSTTDDSNNTTNFTYDGAGNPETTQSAAVAASASVTHNTDGTVATATSPGNATSGPGGTPNSTVYSYTNHQLTTVTPPTGSTLGVQTSTYDGFGRLATQSDGKGVTTTYGYDKIDRLISTTFSDATHSVVNTYNNAGQELTSVSGSGTITNTYDQLGRLLTTTNTAGGGTETYTYDKASNLATATDSRGTTTYAFDASGVPTQLTYVMSISGTPVNGVLGFATDANGRRTDEWLATNASHTVWSAHTHTDYDNSGRVTHVVAQYGSGNSSYTTEMDETYCYNGASPAPTCATGQSTDHAKLRWTKNNLTGLVTNYGYDASGRLTTVTESGTGANNYTYTYDADGNRTASTVVGATPSTQALTYNSADQLTTTGTTFDGTGNLTADAAGTYTYNGAEQMTSVKHGTTTYNYTYAGSSQNQILSEGTPTGTYSLTYGRTDQQGQAIIEQVHTPQGQGYIEHDPVTGSPLLLRTATGKQSLYVYDGTGDPTALLTADSYVAFAYTYDPYGVPTLQTNSGGDGVPQNPYLFKGGIQDRTTGWVHFGGRWYNTTTGTWTQRDTLDSPLDPANANRYAYAGDDPINNDDPTGASRCSDAVAAFLGDEVLTTSLTVGLVLGVTGEIPSLGLDTPATIIAAAGVAATSLTVPAARDAAEDACPLYVTAIFIGAGIA
jgi:RHS repeat-associated protein